MVERSRHRFIEVARELQEEIRQGGIVAGALLPTEKVIQERFEVSRTTVRRAFQQLVDWGWAEQLPNRGVIAKVGPLPGQNNQIAFIDHLSLVHKALFFRLHTLLNELGYQLIHVDSEGIGTLGAMEKAADMGCSAALVWPKIAFVSSEDFARIQSRMPVVVVDHSMGEPCELVMSDHFSGARAAVSHLMSLGRKRIAITGNFTHHEDCVHRFAGYVAAFNERGIIPEPGDYVFSSPGGCSYEDTRLLSFRLSQPDRPDALFVLHDMSVPAIVEAVFDAGLRIPQDVAVIGFGNDLPLTFEGVALSTVAMSWDAFSRTLVARMVARIERPNAPFRRTLVPTHLVIRGSCGAPANTWSTEGYEVSSVTVTGRMPPSRQEYPRFSTLASRPTTDLGSLERSEIGST